MPTAHHLGLGGCREHRAGHVATRQRTLHHALGVGHALRGGHPRPRPPGVGPHVWRHCSYPCHQEQTPRRGLSGSSVATTNRPRCDRQAQTSGCVRCRQHRVLEQTEVIDRPVRVVRTSWISTPSIRCDIFPQPSGARRCARPPRFVTLVWAAFDTSSGDRGATGITFVSGCAPPTPWTSPLGSGTGTVPPGAVRARRWAGPR